MVMVPRNNDLLVQVMVKMANGVNMFISRRDSGSREIAIVCSLAAHRPQTIMMMMMVVVVVVRCARVMFIIIWKSACYFDENVDFTSQAYHQTTIRSAVLSDGTGSTGDPVQTNEMIASGK